MENLSYNNALEWAGGGFATNPHDLVLFARGAFRGDLLSEPYRKLMLDGQPTKEGGHIRDMAWVWDKK
jgi:hypothetical protein